MSGFTQQDYDALKRAIASGQQQVRFGDRQVTYRSHGEMVRALNMMARELGISRGPNRVFTSFDRGLAK